MNKKELPVEKTGPDVCVNISGTAQSKFATVIVLEIEGKP